MAGFDLKKFFDDSIRNVGSFGNDVAKNVQRAIAPRPPATTRPSFNQTTPAQTLRTQSRPSFTNLNVNHTQNPNSYKLTSLNIPQLQPKQALAPTKPSIKQPTRPQTELTRYNDMDVYGQRKRLSELQGLADRKDFNSVEDAENQRWASEQLANVQKFGKKKEGNLLTFGQDLVGGIVAPGAQIVNSAADTIQQYDRGQKLADLYKKGQIDKATFQSGAQSILKNSIDRKVDFNTKGNLVGRKTNPIEFGQKFATEGANAGLTYSPVGAGYKTVAGLGAKAALPTVAKNVLKEGTAYTAANTANDVLQGRGVTPQSVLMNAATSYGGAAVGAGAALAKPVIQTGSKAMGSQDGRNRAIAAKLAGKEKIPVGIIPEMTTSEKIAFAKEQVAKNPANTYLGNKYRRELANLENAPQVTKTPKESTSFAQALQDAGIAPKPSAKTKVLASKPAQYMFGDKKVVQNAAEEIPTAKSTFANQTVRTSKEVSDPLKTQVKSAEPTFQTVTDVERIAQSDKYLKKTGIKKATTDVKERLSAKQIDDQTVSDAIAVAKSLDQKGNPANLLEASAIYEELSVKLSKAGQTVQAASLLNNRTPAGLQYGAIRALKKSGVEITDQMKKDIGALVNEVRKTKPGSYEDGLARFRLAEYTSKQAPSANTSKAIQLWKAGLLTSPRTSAGNLAGNTAESIFNKGYVDPLANVLDGLFSLFTKSRSRSFTLKGIGSGTKEGIGKAVSYFKTGYDPRNPAQKFDVRQIHYSDTPLGRAAENYTQTVFKLMGVADQPFYYANLRNSLYDQAITAAKNQGLRGAEKQAFVKKFVTEPEKRVMQLADAEARYSVFQNETALGKAASRIKGMEGLPGDVAEFVIPFSGVPSSIATRMIERTPIGTAAEIVKQLRAKKFDQRAMTKAIANGSAAIPLIGAGFALANSGMMTLGYPTDKKERDLWEAEGKQPYSIRVGDQWLSLNYFQPAGNLMAAGAEYAGAKLAGKTDEEAFSQSLAGSAKAFSEQSFLKGVSSIGNAINDPSRFGQTFTESTAGSVVPNIIRTGARAFDPVKREVDNAGESIMAGIPGLRDDLDAKTNILGEDVQRNSSTLNEIINPTKPSDIQNADNPIIKELRRLQDAGEGIVPTEATKSSLPDLDTKQLRKVNKEAAQKIASEWQSKILSDPRYEVLIDSDKKKILDRVNDTVFGAVKSDYKETKLNSRQQQYKKGEAVDYFDGFDAAGDAAKKDAKATKRVARKAKKARKGRAAKKSRKDFKLFGFESADPESVGKNLRKLIEEAVI